MVADVLRLALLLIPSFALHLVQSVSVAQNWTVVRKSAATVMGARAASHNGIAGGFEGGEYFRTDDGLYHYFATEMVQSGANLWVGTRGGHWVAEDPSLPEENNTAGRGWRRLSTIFTSSGTTDGFDRASAKWAPMVNFGWSSENNSNVYTLWYIAYRSGAQKNSSRQSGHWANWDGQVRRLVSTIPGNSSAALAGPYVDAEVVLDSEQRDASLWEGLQGTDSVNCYQLPNGTWIMFYGTTLDKCPDKTSARYGCRSGFQRLGRTVAFASSPRLSGPWKRLQMQQETIEPLTLQKNPNMENPVVTKSPWQSGYHAVYAALDSGIGFTFSPNGEPTSWQREETIPGLRGRTALGLVPEPQFGRGYYSMLYTANHVYYVLLRNENEGKSTRLPTNGMAEKAVGKMDGGDLERPGIVGASGSV